MFERQATSVRKLLLGIIAVTAVLSSVGAQESGLYGSVGDDSRAFVRIINATSEERLEGVRVGPNRFPEVETVSPYRLVKSGVYIVSAAGMTAELIARAGEFTTVVVIDGEVSVHADSRHEDPARAQLILYAAAASTEVSLVTADGAVSVVPAVAPTQSTEVVVNAITAQLAVIAEEEILRVFDPIALSRGQSYAFAVLPAGRTERVVWSQAEVASE